VGWSATGKIDGREEREGEQNDLVIFEELMKEFFFFNYIYIRLVPLPTKVGWR
jgi:hypothetical protein